MKAALFFMDIISVVAGIAITFVLFDGYSIAQGPGAGPGHFWTDHGAHLPFDVIALALALAALPLARRGLVHLCSPHSVAEFQDMAAAIRRLGHQHRVHALNLYLAHLPEERWRNVFATENDLWNWLGEAFQDRELRAQMRPEVASRVARAGQATGRLATAA